jgi:23S rRNA pseudouridine2605 synthase
MEPQQPTQERLQKALAKAGYGSRRACETLIEAGRVTINGRQAALGDKVDLKTDLVTVDGMRVKPVDTPMRYFALNKPEGVLSATTAEPGDRRQTVIDLVPLDGHYFTIGRLDIDSEGLMIITNDGDMANRLTHPRYQHTRTYKVIVTGKPSKATLETWQDGVWMDGSRTSACYIRVLESTNKATTLRLIMIEGRKRQIRRIAEMLGHPVIRLVRTHIGHLGIGTLEKGAWYELNDDEVVFMQKPARELDDILKRRRARRAKRPTP